MADRTIKVLDPAEEFDLLTIEEAKLLLGMSLTDTTHDQLLALWISMYSATVSELCNRTFAKQTVTETWRETVHGRLFLSQWPIDDADVVSVSNGNIGLFPEEYELENQSGKLSLIDNPGGDQSTPWIAPAVVTYTGGYVLPDEAPWPLKQATALLIQDARIRLQQAQVAGIRQIMHKHARVVFFDPNAILIKTAGQKSPAMQAAEVLLRQYMRFEI
jgi:hypothetical protein